MTNRIIFLFLSLFIIFAPIRTFAASTCYCYFGEKNDCAQTSVDENAIIDECQLTCETKYQDTFKSVDFTDEAGGANDVLALMDCSSAHADANEAATKPFQGGVIPKLNVDIPTVTFTPVLQKGGNLSINFLADYIQGVYIYLLSIAAIIAVVYMMIGGLRWVLAAGGASNIGEAKTMIKNAVIGLVLLLSVVLILETVNPQLATFNPFTIERIQEVTIDEQQHAQDAEEESQEPTTPTQVPAPSGTEGTKVSLAYSDGGRLKMEYIQLPLDAGDEYITPPRVCTVPVPSEPASLSGVEINTKFLGNLDCNISKQTKNKKRPDSQIKMVILHQGFKSDGGQNGSMWFQNYVYGTTVVCKKEKSGVFNYKACQRNGQKLVKQPTLNQTPIGSHFAVTLGGTIYQLADVGHIMNHCCAENKISVGIDLQYDIEGGKNVYSDSQYKSLAKLIKGLSEKYKFPIDDSTIKGHCELGKHSDPPNFDLKKLGNLMGVTLDPGQHGNAKCSWVAS
ncbi:N-acetylmuramoyl-L-alanine amidase [Candidatus Uhrbacteria bacterium]|nr:N-acetylmuramoyl-L-alanine amidase [Candidatus Uhrbacteria bacterium]